MNTLHKNFKITNLFNYIIKRTFSKTYEGIKGDVNWVNGEIVDGRPNLRRGNSTLPKRKYKELNLISSDFSEELKQYKNNPVFLTYNLSKHGVGKRQDIVTEKK